MLRKNKLASHELNSISANLRQMYGAGLLRALVLLGHVQPIDKKVVHKSLE